MKKICIAVSAVLFGLLLWLPGCDKSTTPSPANPLVGRWYHNAIYDTTGPLLQTYTPANTPEFLVITADTFKGFSNYEVGSVYYDVFPIPYSVNGDTIWAYEDGGQTPTDGILYSLSGGKLRLYGDNIFEYSPYSGVIPPATWPQTPRYENDSSDVVLDPVDSVVLSSAVESLVVAKKCTLTALVYPNTVSHSVLWRTSDTSVATVTNGIVTAIAEGSAIITVRSTLDSTDQDSCVVTVTAGWTNNGIRAAVAGSDGSMILKTDGTLWACGKNVYGQLGDGTATNRLTPVLVMRGVGSVSAGASHTMILKTDGTLWACGYNGFGQLGITATNSWTPIEVMSGVASVAAGGSHSMILKLDGTLWVCGGNYYGQLGDGTTTNRSNPIQVMSGIESISAGNNHSMILKTDGTLWACGVNNKGQLGDGTSTNRSNPVQVMIDVVSVSAGNDHNMILKTDGTLWACGNNEAGQLGDGTSTNRSNPVQVMSGVPTVSAGYLHSMILKNNGTLWAVGHNGWGQLGDGTSTNRSNPVQVMSGVLNVSAGGSHSMILKANGTLWACGDNYYGQLGDSTTTKRLVPVMVP